MIDVEKEPEASTKEFFGILEKCYFCNIQTLYWYEPTNTPVCQTCAKVHEPYEIAKKSNPFKP